MKNSLLAVSALAAISAVWAESPVENIVLNALTPIAKSDICRALPDVSPTTVESVLGAMVRNGTIRKVGEGRGVRYIRRG